MSQKDKCMMAMEMGLALKHNCAACKVKYCKEVLGKSAARAVWQSLEVGGGGINAAHTQLREKFQGLGF